MTAHEVKIITFQRGYPTIIEQAEATIARLLDQGWQLGTGGGSASTGFVVLLRQVESPGEGPEKGVLQPAAPAPARRPASDGGTPPSSASPPTRKRRAPSGQTYGPLED